MKKVNNRNIILLLLIFIVFAACEKVVNIDIPEMQQKPVLFSLIGDSNRIKVFVGHTYGILNYVNESELTNQDSTTVRLYVNNSFRETLTYTSNYYISNYKATAGDSITLFVETNSKDTLSAKTYVPFPVPLDSISLTAFSFYDEENTLYSTATIHFKDPPGKPNYYEVFFRASCISDSGNFLDISDYKSNSVILSDEDILNYEPQSIVFSDRLFDGDKISIPISFSFPCFNDTTGEYIYESYILKVYFLSVSESYYQYRKDLYKYLYAKYGGIWEGNIEPKNIFSNVKGGYGLLAGFSSNGYIVNSTN